MSSLPARLCAAFLITTFAGLAPAGAARAQDAFQTAKLEAFVRAAIEVDVLAGKWRPRIRGAETAEASDALQLQAQDEMVAAIDKAGGITVGEYLEINRAAESDARLRARLEQMYQAKRGN